jgi:gluconate 2-dehydrogenase gamma chain
MLACEGHLVWAAVQSGASPSDSIRREDLVSKHFFSRRDLLRASLASAAMAAAPAGALASAEVVPPESQTGNTAARAALQAKEPLETLSATESDTLEAIVARLIPTDANGMGATEARAAHYIDRALAGALASSRSAYAAGLSAVEQYARSTKGGSFVKLSPEDQDAVLTDMENDIATGFTPSSSTFFNLVREHTLQGMFCDPFYGGNANFVGWDLLGYPGVRTQVSPDQQRIGIELAPNHKSAYDYEMFTKTSARVSWRGSQPDGD